MKKVMVMWFLLVILIFGVLTVFGFKYLKVKDYKNYEKNLKSVARRYMGEHVGEYPETGDLLYLNESELTQYNQNKIEIENDACIGFVVIQKGSAGYKYKSYIKCNKYTTKNYENMIKIS